MKNRLQLRYNIQTPLPNRENAISYLKNYFSNNPSLLSEPLVMFYNDNTGISEEESLNNSNVLLAIGRGGDGLDNSKNRDYFIIDYAKHENEIILINEGLDDVKLSINEINESITNIKNTLNEQKSTIEGFTNIINENIISTDKTILTTKTSEGKTNLKINVDNKTIKRNENGKIYVDSNNLTPYVGKSPISVSKNNKGENEIALEIHENDDILEVNNDKLTATLYLQWYHPIKDELTDNDELRLMGRDNKIISRIPINDFIKFGLLDDVTIDDSDSENTKLVFVFNTNSGKNNIEIPLEKFISGFTNDISTMKNDVSYLKQNAITGISGATSEISVNISGNTATVGFAEDAYFIAEN